MTTVGLDSVEFQTRQLCIKLAKPEITNRHEDTGASSRI